MRLIRICTNYPDYLQQFYAQRPKLQSLGYAEQYRTLMDDCYGWADFWTHALSKLGYAVWEPVGNAELMQKAWAHEHGIQFSPEMWMTDIITAQVKAFQPDIVFVNDYRTYTADFFRCLKEECPSIRLIIGWCGAPFLDGSVFKAYDVVLSNIPEMVDRFRREGYCCKYMCHAFEPRILEKITPETESFVDFSFLGSIVKHSDFHNTRETILRYLIRRTDLQMWVETSNSPQPHQWALPIKQFAYGVAQRIKRLPGGQPFLHALPKLQQYANMNYRPELPGKIDPEIVKRSSSALYGLCMYQKLYESRITLNTHIDISKQSASNMRLYEATGVGTCLLTEWQPNLHEIFEPDVDVVTYQSQEEIVEKVQYLLSHEAERRQIAKAGQQRTLKNHTFDLRAEELDVYIRQALKQRSSV